MFKEIYISITKEVPMDLSTTPKKNSTGSRTRLNRDGIVQEIISFLRTMGAIFTGSGHPVFKGKFTNSSSDVDLIFPFDKCQMSNRIQDLVSKYGLIYENCSLFWNGDKLFDLIFDKKAKWETIDGVLCTPVSILLKYYKSEQKENDLPEKKYFKKIKFLQEYLKNLEKEKLEKENLEKENQKKRKCENKENISPDTKFQFGETRTLKPPMEEDEEEEGEEEEGEEGEEPIFTNTKRCLF